MRYLIQKASLYGEDILKNCRRGTVHSVYKKAINLSLENKLLSFQPAGSPMSPISLITDISRERFEDLEIEINDVVIIEEDAVIIRSKVHPAGEYRFSRSETTALDLRLSGYLTSLRINKLTEDFTEALAADFKDGFRRVLFSSERAELGMADKMAKKWMDEAGKAVKSKKWAAGADCLSRLIGLGTGLTPGGDDFLCGVLAGLKLSNNTQHPFAGCLRERILSGLDRTNDLSRAFLQCALENQYTIGIHTFYRASADEIIDEMRQIGHSSGIDTLCGVFYSFWIREELVSEEMRGGQTFDIRHFD